ncbi:MAG: NTP transferase domain-containing protein [Bacteroidetes bacterium]|nr:NTP transferase domain-containing protein [Bacteroidota bacterium]
MVKQAIIFAAGLGTRFKPWTDRHPKALAIVNGKSLLQRNIEYLQQYGIYNVVVNVHHFANQVINDLKNNKGYGSKVFISDESNLLLETGGGLLYAKKFLNGSDFLSINVDILTDLNLNNMFREFKKDSKLITLAVTNRSSNRGLLFDDNNCLCGWENKITGETKISRKCINPQIKAYSGVAMYCSNIFDFVHQTGKFSVTEIFLDLAKTSQVKGFEHNGDKVLDVGKPESIAIAEQMFL